MWHKRERFVLNEPETNDNVPRVYNRFKLSNVVYGTGEQDFIPLVKISKHVLETALPKISHHRYFKTLPDLASKKNPRHVLTASPRFTHTTAPCHPQATPSSVPRQSFRARFRVIGWPWKSIEKSSQKPKANKTQTLTRTTITL